MPALRARPLAVLASRGDACPHHALKLDMHVGCKTYATLQVYQGVPKSLVMLAIGHQVEAQSNVYLGIDEQELLALHRQTALRLPPLTKRVAVDPQTWPELTGLDQSQIPYR